MDTLIEAPRKEYYTLPLHHHLGYVPTLRELEDWGYEVWTTKLVPE